MPKFNVSFEVECAAWKIDEDGDYSFFDEDNPYNDFYLNHKVVSNVIIEEIEPPFVPGWYVEFLRQNDPGFRSITWCETEDVRNNRYGIAAVRVDVKIADESI
jgi:hypothetical protein